MSEKWVLNHVELSRVNEDCNNIIFEHIEKHFSVEFDGIDSINDDNEIDYRIKRGDIILEKGKIPSSKEIKNILKIAA